MERAQLTVSKKTEPKRLAGLIKTYIINGKMCEIKALGAEPINITVKALALVNTMFEQHYKCEIKYFHDPGNITGIMFEVWA